MYAFSGGPPLPDLDGFGKVELGTDGGARRYLLVTYREARRRARPQLAATVLRGLDTLGDTDGCQGEEVSRVAHHDSIGLAIES